MGFKYKFVAIVNTDLEMGKGKIAGQVGHAVAALMYPKIRDQRVEDWFWEDQVKIILKATDKQIEELENKLIEEANDIIKCGEVHDLGKTQIKEGARTVLWLFGRTEDVDKYINHLKLL